MPTFIKAPETEVEKLDLMMRRYHGELVDAGVTVCLLAAYAPRDKDGNIKSPALKLHGLPCWAIVNANKERHRVEGLTDATICYDGDRWDRLPGPTQLSIFDHELTHLELVLGDDGRHQTDDAGRPKLTMKMHDVEVGWFASTADRHGEDSIERMQARRIIEVHGQTLFPWMEASATRPPAEPPDAGDDLAADTIPMARAASLV